MRATERWALLVAMMAMPMLAGFECPPPGYALEQYHPGEPGFWKAYGGFNDICTELLCPAGTDEWCPDGAGTRDQFEITVAEAARRDRFVFFEGNAQSCFGGVPCTNGSPTIEEWPHPSRPVLPAPGEWMTFRTGGAYSVYEGEGTVRRHEPLEAANHGALRVAHVRRYRRGVCSAADTLSSTAKRLGLREQIGHAVCDKAESDYHVTACRVAESELQVFLGAEPCSDPLNVREDWVHLRYRFEFDLQFWDLHPCGTWEYLADFWFRLVAGPRDQYIYCAETDDGGPECERFFHCTTDAPCQDLVAGATCNSSGLCELRSTLDVEDYGIEFWWPAPRPMGGGVCAEVIRGLGRSLRDIEKSPFETFYAPMLWLLRDQMWGWDPDNVLTCDPNNALACEQRPDVDEDEVEGRCIDSPQVGPHCEFRPWYVHGVNLYPDEVEFVLANERTDAPFSVLNLSGQCDAVPRLVRLRTGLDWQD